MKSLKFWSKAALLGGLLALNVSGQAEVIYSSSFEGDDGGWVGTNDWARGVVTTGDTSDCSGYTDPGGAFDGDEAWGTVLDSCYNNLGDTSSLSQTFDLTNFTSATFSWYQFVEVFYSFDTAEVFVNGDLLYERTTSDATAGYELQSLDLTDYVGGLVTISFDLFATTVVNRAGWYIDSVLLEGTPANAAPEPGTVLLLGLGTLALLIRRRKI